MTIEWGYRTAWGDVTIQPSEDTARSWVENSMPGARILVRREVGDWQEVPATTPPDRSGRFVGDEFHPLTDLDGWQPTNREEPVNGD